MDDAFAAADAGAADGHLIVAEQQTAGRGSRGARWDSPPGTDLYFSVLLRTALPAARRPPLTLAIGLAVAETLDRFTGGTARVKWPNDVYLEGRKCSGILVESKADVVVIGVGVDVNREAGLDTLEATSMAAVAGEQDREAVLVAALDAMSARVDEQLAQGPAVTVASLAPRLLWQGERVLCGEIGGTFARVDPDGALILRTDAGERRCVVGPLRREGG